MIVSFSTTPIGDTISLDVTIAMIIANHSYPTNYGPIDPNISFNVFQYPPGSYVLGVFFSLMLSMPPIHSDLILAGLISALIPILIFSSIFSMSNSLTYSACGFFFSILIPANKPGIIMSARDFVLGNLRNGTYTAHLAVLQYIFLFSIIIYIEKENFKNLQKMLLLTSVYIGVAIFITDYSLGFFLLLFISIITLKLSKKSFLNFLYRKTDKKEKRIFWSILVCFSFIVILLFGFFLIYLDLCDYINDVMNVNYNMNQLSIEYYVTNIFGLIILSSVLIVILKVLYFKRIQDGEIFYLLNFLTLTACAIFPQISYYIFVRSLRNIIRLTGLSLIISLSSLPLFYDNIKIKKFLRGGDVFFILKKRIFFYRFLNIANLKKLKISLKIKLDFTFFFFIFLISILNINPYIYYSERVRWTRPGTDDYEVIQWINTNIHNYELILNDPSPPGLRLAAFEYRNVVFERTLSRRAENDSFYVRRALEALEIFQDPLDYINIRKIFVKYNISYIFISTVNYYQNFLDRENFHKNKLKVRSPYESDELIDILLDNPNLSLEFRYGDSAVFKYVSNSYYSAYDSRIEILNKISMGKDVLKS